MAKNQQVATAESDNVVQSQPTNVTNLDAMRDRIARHSGKGVSTDAADNMVPLIYVLQSGSPQAKKNNPAYIAGAEPGMFWLRNSPNPVASSIEFQSCFFHKEFVEWTPRSEGGGGGSGFQGKCACKMVEGREVPDHSEAKSEVDPKTKQERWFLPNDNELVLTRNHVGFVIRGEAVEPYILPFTSTGHTVSRGWMQQISSRTWRGWAQAAGLPNPQEFPQDTAPSAAFVYTLRLREKRNTEGEWFLVEVGESRPATVEELDRGVALHDAFTSGTKKAEAPVNSDGSSSRVDDSKLA